MFYIIEEKVSVKARKITKLVSRRFEDFCVEGYMSYRRCAGISVPAILIILLLVPF